jgi:hypothetical protein
MGDRYCVGFTADNNNDERRVWLYSHWDGSVRIQQVAEAIQKARPRWSDDSYSTRIAISTIVGDGWNSETGWGIEAGRRCTIHTEYPPLLVNWADQTVSEMTDLGFDFDSEPEVIAVYSFDDFCSKVDA